MRRDLILRGGRVLLRAGAAHPEPLDIRIGVATAASSSIAPQLPDARRGAPARRPAGLAGPRRCPPASRQVAHAGAPFQSRRYAGWRDRGLSCRCAWYHARSNDRPRPRNDRRLQRARHRRHPQPYQCRPSQRAARGRGDDRAAREQRGPDAYPGGCPCDLGCHLDAARERGMAAAQSRSASTPSAACPPIPVSRSPS